MSQLEHADTNQANLVFSFRAFRPQYFLPLIVFGIFINVTVTYGTVFPEMEQCEVLGM
jgi:hypothetical protein